MKLLNRFKVNVGQIGRQAGVALEDVLLGLVIFTLLGIGVYGLYALAGGKSNTTIHSSQIQAIRSQVQLCFKNVGGDYTSLGGTGSYAVAQQCGSFPQQMIADNNNPPKDSDKLPPVNPWGGSVYVYSASVAGAGTTTQFIIESDKVPQDGCSALGTTGYGTWVAILIGTATATPTTGTAINQTAGNSAAVTAVQAACTNASNFMYWTSN